MARSPGPDEGRDERKESSSGSSEQWTDEAERSDHSTRDVGWGGRMVRRRRSKEAESEGVESGSDGDAESEDPPPPPPPPEIPTEDLSDGRVYIPTGCVMWVWSRRTWLSNLGAEPDPDWEGNYEVVGAPYAYRRQPYVQTLESGSSPKIH